MKVLKVKQISVPRQAWEGIKQKKRQAGGGIGLDQQQLRW